MTECTARLGRNDSGILHLRRTRLGFTGGAAGFMGGLALDDPAYLVCYTNEFTQTGSAPKHPLRG
jgi:hypothetical protein